MVLVALSPLGLTACSKDNGGSPGEVATGDEITDNPTTELGDESVHPGNLFGGVSSAADVSHTYSNEQRELIELIKFIAKEHGRDYDFDQMFPVVEDTAQGIEIYFLYSTPHTTGGSPEVLVSRDYSEILELVYTQ